jgi:hypothetical protein
MERERRRSWGHEACLASLGAILLSSGCVVQMYPGPELPRRETARIAAAGASISNIDGMELPVGSTFMVRAGLHAVSASTTGASGEKLGPATICFAAKGGGSYQVGFESDRRISLMDQDTGLTVEAFPVSAPRECAPPRPRPAVAVAASPTPDTEPPPSRGAAPAADDETPTSGPVGAAAVASGPPAERASPGVDSEVPRDRRPGRPVRPTEDSGAERPWVRHPGNGFTLDFGGFFGGTDLATATFTDGSKSTLSGGSGVLFSVGLMLTPLWAGDGAGFGFDAFAGVKYDSVGDSSTNISLTRYPLGLGAHTLLHLGDRWWFIVRGGIVKEVGVSLGGSYGNADLVGSLGGFGEGGIYYVMSGLDGHAALVFTFRYSVSNDSNSGGTFSANSAGAIVAVHFNF